MDHRILHGMSLPYVLISLDGWVLLQLKSGSNVTVSDPNIYHRMCNGFGYGMPHDTA